MTAALTRAYRFSASHRLHSDAFSDEENARLFGKCNNPHGHGHNYKLEVTVRGAVDQATGTVISIPHLDRYVAARVLAKLDGRNINADVPDFRDLVPTTENLTHVIARKLRAEWDAEFGTSGPRLARLHVQETPRNGFELEVL